MRTLKGGRYPNVKKPIVDGIRFDSKAEADFYEELKLKKLAGEIKDFRLQPKVYLSKARILYKPDFKIDNWGSIQYVDVKGNVETPTFRIKMRLWKAYGPGLLEIIKRKRGSFYVDRVIEGVK